MKPRLKPSSNMPRPQPAAKDPWSDLYYNRTEVEMRDGRGSSTAADFVASDD
ncbi:hypothetical protein BKA70DRAFT_1569468 [Coprinopsis sp. MPI-PUGE-AT-0042]|nr:hypothetical protein BKA70DRAFT_1569468 [Coprinopsis sp. MPI-PUGE-AT-0042]